MFLWHFLAFCIRIEDVDWPMAGIDSNGYLYLPILTMKLLLLLRDKIDCGEIPEGLGCTIETCPRMTGRHEYH